MCRWRRFTTTSKRNMYNDIWGCCHCHIWWYPTFEYSGRPSVRSILLINKDLMTNKKAVNGCIHNLKLLLLIQPTTLEILFWCKLLLLRYEYSLIEKLYLSVQNLILCIHFHLFSSEKWRATSWMEQAMFRRV